jgi:molybdopterin-biosynthesis enzyme MoeA-like protein
MGLPNPSAMVRRQTEAVSSQYDSKKAEIFGQIESKSKEQVENVKSQQEAQLATVDGKIDEMKNIKESMDPSDPRRDQVDKQIGLLREQKKQIQSQVKLAIASIRANVARERENIKVRIEREKGKAIRGAVDAVLAQFSMLMAKRKAQAEGAVQDELKSGNRG